MKAIIYYSLSGRTKEELEKRFEGDFYRIKGKLKIPKKYFFQLLYLGMFSSLNVKLKYEPVEIDFDQYDEIVLASPVWAFTITPFLKKFLKDHRFFEKKVTLLVTHEGGPGKVFNHFKKYIDHSNEIVEMLSVKKGSAYKDANHYKKK